MRIGLKTKVNKQYMSKKTNKPHDTRSKELFYNKEVFYSLLKDCVKADWIDDLDKDSLKRSSTSYILNDFKQKEADIVYEATNRSGKQKVIFYVLMELQSKVDYRMPYRLLLYITEVLRDFFNNSDTNARTRKGFKFPAVIPIVFFSGKDKWTVPTNLREMFNGYKKFGESLLNFNYTLVDVKGYDDERVKGFHSRLLKVMMLLEQARNKEELIGVLLKYVNDIIQFDDEELRIISAATSILDGHLGAEGAATLSDILKTKNAERVTGMLANIVEYERRHQNSLLKRGREEGKKEGREEGRKEGREEGRKEERVENAKAFLKMGSTIEQVAAGTGLTISEVEKIKVDNGL